MPESVRVGEATITHLSDTEQAYGANAVYPEVEEAVWEEYRGLLTPDGQVLLNFGCYLIQADGRTVLVDTGWGPGFNGRLLDELDAAGVGVADIDTVIFTHLHGDHIGWNLEVRDGKPHVRFPRARYLAPEGDWQHYVSLPEPPSLFREQMLPLEDLGVLELIGGGHVLSRSVTTESTPGHTPGHISVMIASGGEHGCILGDVAISPVEAHETDWVNSFDWDRHRARETRHRTLDRLEGERALVAVSHFPKPGIGYFVRHDGRRSWLPLEIE